MSAIRLLALLPLAYIVWWFYALYFTIVPWLNIALTEIINFTIVQIIGTILFFALGIPVLVGAFILFFALILSD